MGKCFSMVNRGQRKKSDFYETPYSITQQLIDREHISKNWIINDPACGNKAILKVFEQNGFSTQGSDITEGKDFLKESRSCPCIVTNPPYSLAHEFILRAKQVCYVMFCLLLPLSYLHGQRRYKEIYQDGQFPLRRIYVFTRYPMLGEPLREDGKYNTGMMAYAWFVWDKTTLKKPIIEWIDNDQYVLRRGNKTHG